MQRILTHSLPLVLALGAIVAAGWWLPNRLQDLPALPGASVYNSLSYDPSRAGESPLNDHFATREEADEDLAQLAKVTRAIRTYASIEGTYDIPALAQKHGLRVWQGIWLGGNRTQNAREMARAIDLANRYPDTVERVIVGNEVLLRRDLPVDELIADIAHVRAAVHQPVAYADVSDFWDQFPQVAQHVDLVLVHLLPYWEDVPTGIDRAVETVGAVYRHFTTLFSGKQIVIGETGWPSRGRQRGAAIPGRINEARFLRGFIALSAAEHFDYNFFQSFDQSWKYANEGVMGANWGLYTEDRREKITPSGPLREDPDWAWHAAFSVVGGALLSALGLARRGAAAPATRQQIVLLGMTLGAAFGYAAADTAPVLYDAHALVAGLVNLGGQALLAGLMMLRLSGAVPTADWRNGGDATRRITQLFRLRHAAWGGLFEDLCFLFAWTAAVQQILLVFDPRYRVFPVASFAVPLVVLAARAAQGDLPRGTGRREEVLVAATLVVGAVASAVQEGASNGQSLRWNACAVILSVPLWLSLVRRRQV